jgi:catechol 2,3-dioxygenase-like lactoylglutathione lyase family enzyme
MPRINHVALKVTDLEAATKFYENVFGFLGAKQLAPGIYFCPVRLPKLLVPEEFVMDPAPAPFGGMLDPSPTSVLPMSASAVC